MKKTRVLFICTGNSARSQMAEAFLRHLAGDQFEVFSAGLQPKEIHPITIQVMEELGINMNGQSSKSIEQYLAKVHFGYLITVCDKAEQNCPIFPGMGQRLHWPFEDPAAFEGTEHEKLAKFRQVRQEIFTKIREWLTTQPNWQGA